MMNARRGVARRFETLSCAPGRHKESDHQAFKNLSAPKRVATRFKAVSCAWCWESGVGGRALCNDSEAIEFENPESGILIHSTEPYAIRFDCSRHVLNHYTGMSVSDGGWMTQT
eukprot:2074426-Alexandrium_andersonii.AAC.1